MKFRTALTILLLLLPVRYATAQKLPVLPKAKEITTGTLPDGILYYLAENKASKGYADFSLVQKGRYNKDESREKLCSLPHFGTRAPYRFLAGTGVGYSRGGFISYHPDATVYTFEDVPVFNSAASDSTLLMLFDIAGSCPGEQAIVVCGDISAAKMKEKIATMSLFVTPRKKSPKGKAYIWNPRDSVIVRFSENPTRSVASLTVSYTMPRVENAMMNTPAPLVTDLFTRELSAIIRKRVETSFRAQKIPLAAFASSYTPSSRTSGDEQFTVSVSTSSEHIEGATSQLARILAHIDQQGCSFDEFQDARDRIRAEASRNAGNRPLSNSEYTDRCISSYLYGANLASAQTINDFFAGRNMNPVHEHSMLNRFSSELLSPTENITLRFGLPSGDARRGELTAEFGRAWSYARLDTLDRIVCRVNYGDTLTLATADSKVPQVRSVKEPITGGELWTYSNGMKVIFKQTSGSNEFHYGMIIRGGFPQINGLIPGESPFVGDMLRLYDVAGMQGHDFMNMLSANGIEMSHTVSVSSLQISGRAPSNRLPLLMKSMLSIANSRKLNREAFDYYKSCEALRMELENFTPRRINEVVDSIMCPEYRFPDRRSMESLRDDLPARADVYFNNIFRNCSDGVLVLIGDLDPAQTKKVLAGTLGGFRTGRRRTPRPTVEFPMRTGWSTYTVNGGGSLEGSSIPNINVALSASVPFTMDKYMAFKIARVMVSRKIVSKLADIGIHAEVSETITILPVERMSLFINCWPCPDEGLPAGILPEDPLNALAAVREALGEVISAKLSDAELKAYKAEILTSLEGEMAQNKTLVTAAMLRYTAGKDIVSNYKTYLNGVTADKVKEILSALEQGSKVEYILK